MALVLGAKAFNTINKAIVMIVLTASWYLLDNLHFKLQLVHYLKDFDNIILTMVIVQGSTMLNQWIWYLWSVMSLYIVWVYTLPNIKIYVPLPDIYENILP